MRTPARSWGNSMSVTTLTILAITIALLGYLVVALLYPEKF